MKTLFVLISFLVVSNSQAYYYYITTKPKPKNKYSQRRAYYAPRVTTTKESKFGSNVASGFSMTYSKEYIHILTHCVGLSTNLTKLVLRGLTLEDKMTKRRLGCYVVGLGKSIEDFVHEGKTAMEIAEESNNHTAIDYMLNL